jgi:hypothetical protein
MKLSKLDERIRRVLAAKGEATSIITSIIVIFATLLDDDS